MKKIGIYILLLMVTNIYAQNSNETLTNKTIIDLHKLKLSSSIIVNKINSTNTNFDTSIDGLIELKKEGVPDEVVNAMLEKSGNSSTANNSNNPLEAHESGIYYLNPKTKELLKLEPNVYSAAGSSGQIGQAFSYGMSKVKQKSKISGSSANLQITEDSLPTFYFYFESTNSGLGNSGMAYFNQATSPNEFSLAKFQVVGTNREVVTGSSNVAGYSSGLDEKYAVAFKFEKQAAGIYKVYSEKAMKDGEYGFFYAGAIQGMGVVNPKVFDFGILLDSSKPKPAPPKNTGMLNRNK